MLHVDPSSVVAAPPASDFCPFDYIEKMSALGVPVHAREINGQRSLVWDMVNIRSYDEDEDAGAPDRRLRAHPANMKAVWDALRAQDYIAGARECGLLLFPWPETVGGDVCLAECGFEDDGEFDYGAGTGRFVNHPAIWYRQDLPDGMLGRAICHDFGIDPSDPALCDKVNERIKSLRAEHAARVAGGAQ